MFTIKTKNEETVFQLENIFETKYKGKMWLIWLALDMSENVNDHPGGDLMKLAGWMQSSLVEIRATSRVVGISSDIGVGLTDRRRIWNSILDLRFVLSSKNRTY